MMKSRNIIKRILIIAIFSAAAVVSSFAVFGPKKTIALAVVAAAGAAVSFAVKKYRNQLLQLVWLAVSIISISAASQCMSAGGMSSFDMLWFTANTLIAAAVVFFFMLLLDNLRLSVIIGGAALLILSYANRCVFFLKGSALTPYDIFAARTAFNVLSNYTLPVDWDCFFSLLLFVSVTVIGFCISAEKFPAKNIVRRIAVLVLEIVVVAAWLTLRPRFGMFTWGNDGAEFNGYLNSFCNQLYMNVHTKPEYYSHDYVEELERRYAQEEMQQPLQDLPHIIVIMDESYADFASFDGKISADVPLSPFISSLKENTVRGHALVSTFGGGTANSEFEFLTGNSMAMLPLDATAYQLYIRSSSYSAAQYLNSVGYRTVATHPNSSVNWSRNKVYPLLGFSEMYFSEVYGHEAPVNTYVSDRETFEYILEQLEGCSAQDRMFLFAVTMQNHGGYDPDNFAPSDLVRIKDADFPAAETYLSCANSTDDAVRYLIESLKEYDEDVLVVFFGDHQPNLPDAFYSDYLCEKTDTLAERMARYTVPFFIWANYDIEEEEYELTSLNYLSVLMYKCAGIALPPYSEFLNDTMEYIPAINAFTYYSAADNCFKTLDEAEGIEAQLIRDYSVLQYNSLFDSERSQVFFR